MSQAVRRQKPAAAPKRGQALAEFALTLPILLLLVFGIIEFARLFQTWVVLQSAARAGARAASVGAINYEIFTVPAADPGNPLPLDLRVLNSVTACLEGDQRGSIITDVGTGVEYYNGQEGLFATMYDGIDCDPASEDDLQLRKDILRIFTVIDAVREAAGTVAVYENRVDQDYNNITPTNAFDFMKGYWNRPYKVPDNATAPGWMSIEMCSTRPIGDGVKASVLDTRFVTIRNSADAAAVSSVNLFNYPMPFCMLNERPITGTPGSLDNAGHRWFDVGGPGDRVTIFIKFNHPLITPLNLAQYIHLESRRSSVNESFRAPKAVGAFQRSIPPGRDDDDETLPAATDTPDYTDTHTNTFTPTDTATNTATPEPFTCDEVEVIWSEQPFLGSQLYMTIRNGNLQETTLSRARLQWNAKSSYSLMYAQSFALDAEVHWQGEAYSPPPQTLVDTRTNGTFFDGDPAGVPFTPRRIVTSAVWSAMFVNGPSSLQSAFTLQDFTAEFEFSNPDGAPCNIGLTGVAAPPPTDTQVSPPVNSPTPTPSCDALSNIQLQNSVSFDPFDGSVRMNLYNTGTLSVYLLGFRLVWPDRTHPHLTGASNYYLRRVTVGGTNAYDPLTVEVWRANGANQDATGNTRTTVPFDIATASNSSEGAWVTNGILRPGDNYVYLDFGGITGNFNRYGATSQHFHQSVFYIGWAEGCTGPGGGPGTIPTSSVQIALPSPTRTNTPRPTNPPAPTPLPTATRPTNTPRPTNTAVPTLRPSATPIPLTPTVPTRTPLGYELTLVGGGDG